MPTSNKLRSYFKYVDVNCMIPDTDGCRPLHVVAGIENFRNKENIITFLLDKGGDPNARSHENLTPVHIAAMWGNCFQLDKLLQHGGNPWLTDNNNKNSFDMAADNHAYEAFQLLNIYLSEDKFNFKTEEKMMPETAIVNLDNVIDESNLSMNATFFSANEYFPMMLSSFGDNSNSFLLNVSNFIKKKISKPKAGKDSKNLLLSDQNQKCCNKQTLCSTFDNRSQNSTWNHKNTFNQAHFLSSQELETSGFSFFSQNNIGESIVETTINMDNDEKIQLVEIKNVPDEVYSSNISINSEASSWKSYHSDNNSDSSLFSYCSHSKASVIIPAAFKYLTNSEIYERLIQLGDDPGPVLDNTRHVYLLRLARLSSGCSLLCELPAPKYCREIYQYFETPTNRGQKLEEIIAAEFDSDTGQNWREGNQRCSFNYFLLDPRVTQNLSSRATSLSTLQLFLTFLDALFYVGKGTKGRPYSHLIEAAKAKNNENSKSEKISHILDIWKSDFGVISLHCFQNAKAVEAYTREACIIEAIGLNNLTNIKKGNYYGSSARLTVFKKRLVGISLLHRALQIFLLEGDRQIRPKDVY